jgi:hypothetical protein
LTATTIANAASRSNAACTRTTAYTTSAARPIVVCARSCRTTTAATAAAARSTRTARTARTARRT